MRFKNKKIIALGLATTTIIGMNANIISVLNVNANEVIQLESKAVSVIQNAPSISVRNNVVSLIDNGTSNNIIDDFSSTSPFKYSNSKWSITGSGMQSNPISHNQSTENSFTITANEGDILNIKGHVASEDYYDIGSIYIDDVLIYEGYGNRTPFDITKTLSKGTHTIKFKYTKDRETSYYEDCMVIKKITLTSTTDSASMKYRIDGGAWKTYTSDFTLDFSNKNSYLVEYKSISSSGVESAIQKRQISKPNLIIQNPEIINKRNGFILKDNGVKTYSVRDTFDTTNNISYSNDKWTISNGQMTSNELSNGEVTKNSFKVVAEDGDILNIKGLIKSDRQDDVAVIYVDGIPVFSSGALSNLDFNYALEKGNHTITIEFQGGSGNIKTNAFILDEISVSTSLNSTKIQYRLDGGSWIDYTKPVELDYANKNSYVVEVKTSYDNLTSNIVKKTLTKATNSIINPTIDTYGNTFTISDGGYNGVFAYDDFTFKSDFTYSNPKWTIVNNKLHSEKIKNKGQSTLLEFNVDISDMATLKILGSHNSKDNNDFLTLYIDDVPVSTITNRNIDINTNLFYGTHKIGLEFSKNSIYNYDFKGVIDSIILEGHSKSKEILYKVDDGQWLPYKDEVTLDFSNTTTHTIYAKTIDNDGNESAVIKEEMFYDSDYIPDTSPDKPPVNDTPTTSSETLNVIVNANNTIELSMSTNTISFDSYNGTKNFENDDLSVSITSGLNYDLSASMTNELSSSEGYNINSNLLGVKEGSMNEFNTFETIGQKVFLVTNASAGRDNIHNITFKLLGDSSVKAGNYSTTIKFEVEQK